MDPELRRRLAAVAGEAAVDEEGVVTPSTAAGVAAVMSVCAGSEVPVRVTSGPASGGGPAGEVLLSLSRLKAVSVDAANLVLWVEAGVTVDAIRAASHREGLAIGGLPPTTSAGEVGGLLARGELPRRSLTGLDLVLGSGRRVTWGGRMLKDVTGYDIPALVLGAMGRLAIIVAAGLRLEPARAGVPAHPPAGPSPVGTGHPLAAALDPRGLLRSRS